MNHTKHRVLICSPQADFLKNHRMDLDNDFDVQFAATEEICQFLAKDWKPHIVLIDGDSFGNFTSQLRQAFTYSQMGLIVICQKEGIFKEEFAFRSGADHFIFDLKDYKSLVWRIVSLVRKMQNFELPVKAQATRGSEAPSTITFKNIKIYPQDFLVKCNGRVIKITPIQFKLLVAFITHEDQLLSRQWLQENIWEGSQISPRSIDAQISKLKKVVPEIGNHIINVYGQGYVLTPEGRQAA